VVDGVKLVFGEILSVFRFQKPSTRMLTQNPFILLVERHALLGICSMLPGGPMLRSLSSPLACLLIFLFSPRFASAQRPFTVGTASASPGEKATGYLEVPAGIDAATNIPVVRNCHDHFARRPRAWHKFTSRVIHRLLIIPSAGSKMALSGHFKTGQRWSEQNQPKGSGAMEQPAYAVRPMW
jgi:hypothetical protein